MLFVCFFSWFERDNSLILGRHYHLNLKIDQKTDFSIPKHRHQMKLELIEALGNFLMYYHSDLMYIRNFQRLITNNTRIEDHLETKPGTFQSFINEFRVARNFEKGKTDVLLKHTLDYISENDGKINVDDFAESLCQLGITHGKIMTSLASKILFLSDPWRISPLDNLVKKAIGLRENRYCLYELKFNEFKMNHSDELNDCLDTVGKYVDDIESRFEGEIVNIQDVRMNRLTDKLLWTLGK